MNEIPGLTVIEDDAEAKALIVDYGRFDAFYQHPEMPRLFIFWTDTPKQLFFLAAQYRGFEKPEDNGFMVWIMDMAVLAQPQIIAFVQHITSKGRDTTGPMVPWHHHTIQPQGN